MKPVEASKKEHEEVESKMEILKNNLIVLRNRQMQYLAQNPDSWRGVGPGTEIARVNALLDELLEITDF
jgi:ribosomal protein L29